MDNSKSSKYKKIGQKVFLKIGNMAIGNNEKGGRNNSEPIVPFSALPTWLYEKPMPKRKD